MLKTMFKSLDALWSVCRSLAGDERGSLTVEIGFCGIVCALLITGIFGLGGAFSKEITADLSEVKALLVELS